MKKIIVSFVSILIVLSFCSCNLPNISIQIGYDDENSTFDSTQLPDTQSPVTVPVETECSHSYRQIDNRSDGRCVNCGYCNAYIASFYDVSELVIKYGTAYSNGQYRIQNICPGSSFGTQLVYNKTKNEFTLITSDSASSMNIYITIDYLRNCSFVAGLESSGEAVCAATGRIDTSTYSLSGFVSISKYDGPEYLKDAFIDTCEAFVDGTLAEFAVYIETNTAYTISDLGFKNLKV